MYDVLWFERGNDLKKRACFFYERPTIDVARDWKAHATGARDSVQVYKDGNLIWVDGREVGMCKHYEANDRVILTRAKSIKHFANAPFGRSMPITGRIISVDYSHFEGNHMREIEIKFDDERIGWYGDWEIAFDR